MNTPEEPQLEALLREIYPGCENRWEGASEDEVAELESFVDFIPDCHRWFLARMGRNNGGIQPPLYDMRISTVLEYYRSATRRRDLVLIGREPGDMMPMDVFLWLARPARGDAMIASASEGGALHPEFETMRELLGYDAIYDVAMRRSDSWCKGRLRWSTQSPIVDVLGPAMEAMGFEQPIMTGPRCALFRRDDIHIASFDPPTFGDVPNSLLFKMGASHSTRIRTVLGKLAVDHEIEVEIYKWSDQ